MASQAPHPAHILLLLACIGLTPCTHASDRVDAEIAPVLAKLAEAGELPRRDEPPLALERPERSHFELGAVVDLRRGGTDGATVMAVSPGSAAERMGLEPGDRLLSVNGRPLAAASDLSEALAATNGELAVEVRRDAGMVSLSGSADRITIPAYVITISSIGESAGTGCGRVSQGLRPPISQEIHPLVIHDIDGRNPGPLRSTVFTLAEGRNVLRVSEAIRDDRFTGNQNRKRAGLFRYERFKHFTLDVAPDTTYRLGARLIAENREDIRGGSYWEPVVWAEFEERCR